MEGDVSIVETYPTPTNHLRVCDCQHLHLQQKELDISISLWKEM